MSVAEITKLPVREKFQILEALWEDLSDKIEDIPLTGADRDLLDHRLARIESGAAKILEWDDVKPTIGEA